MNATRRAIDTASWRGRSGPLLWPAIALAAAAFVVYWPALNGDFIWDDDALVTQNALVRAADGLYRMWLTTQPLDYWPMTNSSFWLEWRLWGMHASGYHVTNLLLHVGSALLLWAILRRLSIPGAWLAAFLFALHPVNVESVAWIAQRKNTLSMVFFLLSVLWYLKSDTSSGEKSTRLPDRQALGVREEKRGSSGEKRARRPDDVHQGGTTNASAGRRAPVPDDDRQGRTMGGSAGRRAIVPDDGRQVWFWLSLVAFALAMLSKGSVAVLPAVLLLLAWWRRSAITATDIRRAAPFLVVAVALTLVNVWFQSRTMPHGIRDVTLVERVLGAGAVVWFYLYKALLPINLIFIYPQWNVHSADWRWWLPLAAGLAVTGLLIWQWRRPLVRALLFAWLFFCVALIPVMGLTDVYFMRYSLVADHYEYIAIMGVVACAAAGLPRLSALVPAPLDGRWWGAILVAVLGLSTWQQTRMYASGTTIYLTTLSRNPAAWMAHNNLALSYLHGSAADFQKAVAHLQAALAINPKEPSLHHNLGITLFQMDRFEEAEKQHREAVRLQPDYADAHSALGADLQKLGRNAEAAESYQQALRLQPQMTSIRASLAVVLAALGRQDEAGRELQQGLQSEARTVQEHGAKGDALLRVGRTEDAIAQYTEALQLDPNSAHTMNNLGYALMVAGRLDEAERHLRQALRLRPEDAAAHDNLGNVLQQMQRLDEAILEFTAALKTASPVDLAEIHNDFGIALAKLGRRDEAIAHFREALRRKPDFAAAQANLAKAMR